MLGDARSRTSLVASLALHLALGLSIVVGALPAARTGSLSRDRADSWSGDTFEVDAVVGTGLPKPRPAEQPETPAPADPAEVMPPAPPSERAKTPAEAKPTPADLPSDEPSVKPEPVARRKPDKSLESDRDRPAQREKSPAAPSAAAGENDLRAAMAAAAAGTEGPRYGAAGLEPGVRNLAKAFTRAIPRVERSRSGLVVVAARPRRNARRLDRDRR